jgi:PLP dependent protein
MARGAVSLGVTVSEDIDRIPERLAAVRASIEEASRRSGRAPSSVRLVAVSKTKPLEAIRKAYETGQRDFGENYVQEMVEKASALVDLEGLRFHFIGALQRNKAKACASVGKLVHTVDREEIAAELDRRTGALGRVLDVLVEVNVGDEASKAGCRPDRLTSLLDAARRRANLRVVGLMAIPPYLDDPEAVRPYFARLRELRDAHGGASALPELSMGMSHDFHVAIEEGATLVRVGTAIFGAR